jgi:hypothetical protein
VSDLERPVHHRPRRLAQWLNPTGTTKVHSLIDKVYERKNLIRAAVWIKREGASKGAPSFFCHIQRSNRFELDLASSVSEGRFGFTG